MSLNPHTLERQARQADEAARAAKAAKERVADQESKAETQSTPEVEPKVETKVKTEAESSEPQASSQISDHIAAAEQRRKSLQGNAVKRSQESEDEMRRLKHKDRQNLAQELVNITENTSKQPTMEVLEEEAVSSTEHPAPVSAEEEAAQVRESLKQHSAVINADRNRSASEPSHQDGPVNVYVTNQQPAISAETLALLGLFNQSHAPTSQQPAISAETLASIAHLVPQSQTPVGVKAQDMFDHHYQNQATQAAEAATDTTTPEAYSMPQAAPAPEVVEEGYVLSTPSVPQDTQPVVTAPKSPSVLDTPERARFKAYANSLRDTYPQAMSPKEFSEKVKCLEAFEKAAREAGLSNAESQAQCIVLISDLKKGLETYKDFPSVLPAVVRTKVDDLAEEYNLFQSHPGVWNSFNEVTKDELENFQTIVDLDHTLESLSDKNREKVVYATESFVANAGSDDLKKAKLIQRLEIMRDMHICKQDQKHRHSELLQAKKQHQKELDRQEAIRKAEEKRQQETEERHRQAEELFTVLEFEEAEPDLGEFMGAPQLS